MRWQGWLRALHIAKGTFLHAVHFHPFFIFLITYTADHHNTVIPLWYMAFCVFLDKQACASGATTKLKGSKNNSE